MAGLAAKAAAVVTAAALVAVVVVLVASASATSTTTSATLRLVVAPSRAREQAEVVLDLAQLGGSRGRVGLKREARLARGGGGGSGRGRGGSCGGSGGGNRRVVRGRHCCSSQRSRGRPCGRDAASCCLRRNR